MLRECMQMSTYGTSGPAMGHTSIGIATALCLKVSQAVLLPFLPLDIEREEVYCL